MSEAAPDFEAERRADQEDRRRRLEEDPDENLRLDFVLAVRAYDEAVALGKPPAAREAAKDEIVLLAKKVEEKLRAFAPPDYEERLSARRAKRGA